MTELPPAGWYDDPTSPVQERWWDGERWSEQTRPKAKQEYEHRQGELRPVGDFLAHAFTLIRKRWDEFLLVAVVAAVLLAVVSVVLIRPIIVDLEFVDGEVLGFESSHLTMILIAGAISVVISLVVTMAQYRTAWSAAIDEAGGWATALQYGIANTPRLVGWTLLAFLPVVGGVLVLLFIARSGGDAAVLFLLVLGATVAWWAVTIAFIPAALVIQPQGTNPISISWQTVKGRWWRIFGRGLLMGIIAGIAVNVVTAIVGQMVGSTFFGLDVVDAGGGQLQFEKNLGNSLEFFLGSLVFGFTTLLGNIASFCGITSIAFDVMPRAAESVGEGDFL